MPSVHATSCSQAAATVAVVASVTADQPMTHWLWHYGCPFAAIILAFLTFPMIDKSSTGVLTGELVCDV